MVTEPATLVSPVRPAPSRDPAFRGRLAWLAVAMLLMWPLLVLTEFRPWQMLDERSVRVTAHFLAGFLPPALDADFLTVVALRTVPELVWALVFVRVVGLGPTSGVLAIGLTYGGMLGKVFAEILESCDAHPTRMLLANGSGRLQAFFYGLLPQAAPELTSYAIYRWECAIRSSVVLGFVGAGGLGQQMDSSLKMLAGNEVATMLLVFIGLVALADTTSAWLRRSLR
jgi:phosphonate transport system permease protein